MQRKQIDRAKHYYLLSIKHDSTFASAYWNYGLTVYGEARILEEVMYEEKQKAIQKINNRRRYTPPQVRQSVPLNNTPDILKTESQRTMPQIYNPPIRRNTGNQSAGYSDVERDRTIRKRMKEIEDKYAPLIIAKLEEYRKYRDKANELGIVHKFPLEFFRKQAESIKQFKEKGGYYD